MLLTLTLLEDRSTPALTYLDGAVPGYEGQDFFPGFDGPVNVAYGHLNADVTIDLLVVPGPGGGPVSVGVSGGTGGWVEVIDPVLGPVLAPEGWGDELFRRPVFPGAMDERIGLDVTITTRGPGRPGMVYGTWDKGGGPLVNQYDPETGEEREFLAAEPEFRGGLSLTYGTVYLAGIDADRALNSDLIVSAKPGGGPVVRAFDAAGNQIVSVFAGDPESRDGVTLSPTLVGIQVDRSTDEYGFGVDLPGGGTSLWTWAGRLVSTTRDGDPGTEWRL